MATPRLRAQFDKAISIIVTYKGPIEPTKSDRLTLYSNYKQATVGDCTTSAPSLFDIVGKFKHNAWKALAGKSKESAMAAYVEHLKVMLLRSDDSLSRNCLGDLEAAGA